MFVNYVIRSLFWCSNNQTSTVPQVSSDFCAELHPLNPTFDGFLVLFFRDGAELWNNCFWKLLTLRKYCPVSLSVKMGNNQKLHGARSGLQTGCSRVLIFLLPETSELGHFCRETGETTFFESSGLVRSCNFRAPHLSEKREPESLQKLD